LARRFLRWRPAAGAASGLCGRVCSKRWQRRANVRPGSFVDWAKPFLDEAEALARLLDQVPGRTVSSRAEALLLLTSGKVGAGSDFPAPLRTF